MLIYRVFDVKMLVLTKTPINTGRIQLVGKNLKKIVILGNVLKTVPKKFDGVSASVQMYMLRYKMPLPGEFLESLT